MRKSVRWALAAVVAGGALFALTYSGGDTLALRGVTVGTSATFAICDPPDWVPAPVRGSAFVQGAFRRDTAFHVATPAEGDALFVHLSHAGPPPGATRIEGACGCAWSAASTITGPTPRDTVVTFARFPRRSAQWTLRGAHDLTIDNPAPLPPAGTDEVADECPVTTKVGDETWILGVLPDSRFLTVRAVDARRSGFEWTYRVAVLSDASGNRLLRRPPPGRAREQKIALPGADPSFHLCPHEPWWELTIHVDDAKTVTFRFRPPA